MDAAKDIVYLSQFFNELQIGGTEPTSIISNNQSCIKLVQNPILHACMTHVEIQYYFIRKRSQAYNVIVSYISTIDQQAHIFIKPLKKPNYDNIREALGIIK